LEAEREDIAISLPTEIEGDDDAEETDEAEPEDDFNAAWEVLELARAIYNKQAERDPNDEVKLKLADTYIALGDVSLETGILHSHS
jgi:HAT1-interacting factor 1